MEYPEKDILELRQHYRNVLCGSSGTVVFHDILSRGGFFNNDFSHESPEELGRHNLVMEIIEILGAYAENPERVSKAISDALLQQPIKEIKDEED